MLSYNLKQGQSGKDALARASTRQHVRPVGAVQVHPILPRGLKSGGMKVESCQDAVRNMPCSSAIHSSIVGNLSACVVCFALYQIVSKARPCHDEKQIRVDFIWGT